MKPWLPLILLLPLSGCLSGDAPVKTESCIKDMCVLAEPEPYWDDYRDRFGMEQVPFTHGGRAGGFEVGPGFMVWAGGNNETELSDLYALDFEKSRIIPFGTETVERPLDREVHGREVAFTLEDESVSGLERFSMWMWSFDNETKWQLHVPLEGDKLGVRFDGEWILFANTLRTYRAVELWAYNIDEGRLMQLFQPEPRNRHDNGTYEVVRTPVLHAGIAYYTVGWLFEDGTAWTDIYATRLETNTTTHLKRLHAIQVNTLDANHGYLAYSNDVETWVLPLDDVASEPLIMPKTKATNHGARVIEKWIFYVSREGLVQDLIAINLETGKQAILVRGDETFIPGLNAIQGDHVYIHVQVVNPYDSPYHALRVFTMDVNALP